MSKVVKAVVGVGSFVASFIPGVGPALGAALRGIGMALFSSAILQPKIRGAEERQASETTLQLGEGPRMVGFGTFSTGPALLDPA